MYKNLDIQVFKRHSNIERKKTFAMSFASWMRENAINSDL